MNRLHRLGVLLVFSSSILIAQNPPAQSGKFQLHKFEQPIGEESYTITPDGNALTLKTDFKFTDRGTPVPLTATLRTSDSYVPQSFVISGKTSRMSATDTEVKISNGSATIRQGKETRTVAVPKTFFTISGYAPVAVQMEMMRYWRAHGQPAQMDDAADRRSRIQDRGSETIADQRTRVQVERYTVQGLIWGMETLWMDSSNNLAALVSTDAEFDHFEATFATTTNLRYRTSLPALLTTRWRRSVR